MPQLQLPPCGILKGGIISGTKLPVLPKADSVGAVQALDSHSREVRVQQIQEGLHNYTRDQTIPIWDTRSVDTYYTPGTACATPLTLTRRSADMLGGQLRHDQRYIAQVPDPRDRDSYVSVEFLEWLMGYPTG